MSRSVSDAAVRRRAPLLLLSTLAAAPAALVLAPASLAALQDAASAEAAATQQSVIQSSEISLSRGQAMLHLDLANGRTLELAISNGRVLLNGNSIGTAPRGGRLDQAWRELLSQAIDASAADLSGLLVAWDPPRGDLAQQLDAALEAALDPASAAANVAAEATAGQEAADAAAPSIDTIESLNAEIERLNAEIREQRDQIRQTRVEVRGRSESRSGWSRPFRHITNGIAGILSILVAYAVLFGIGLAVIFFGGRRHIEAVADTARHQTLRALFVGLAGACLLLPAFILGIIALAISIVGIPALIAWIPLFPVAAMLALLLGYLAVAHAAGEALAERRFYATDWFRRGNSYYFMMTGLGLLVAFFLASQVVSMAGPWLGFFHGLLMVLGVVVTAAAFSIGFGAVLISRAGTRPSTGGEPDLFSEDPSV